MNEDQIKALSESLARRINEANGKRLSVIGWLARLIGKAIDSDHQGHIDDLVAAGVLAKSGVFVPSGTTLYRVIPTHEHRLVWSGDPKGQPCVVCVDGDLTAFYPYEVGTAYIGPVPESAR